MGYYFDADQSIYFLAAADRPRNGRDAGGGGGALAQDIRQTVAAISKRYVRDNPARPFTYRAYSAAGILRDRDYRYLFDLERQLPHAKPGEFVYAWATYHADQPTDLKCDISVFSPTQLYLNGRLVFKSTIYTERYPDQRTPLTLTMEAGWNHLLLRFTRTPAGFGGIFGTWLGKHPFYFLMPSVPQTAGREGQEGWIFTDALSEEPAALPGPDNPLSGLKWHPAEGKGAEGSDGETKRSKEKKTGQLHRLYGAAGGRGAKVAVGRTAIALQEGGAVEVAGAYHGRIRIFVDGRLVYVAAKSSGRAVLPLELAAGNHAMLVESQAPSTDAGRWGFELAMRRQGTGDAVSFSSCCDVKGTRDPWIYIGPFKPAAVPALEALVDLDRVHRAIGGETYWRIDAPATWLRPYNDNRLFGHWNYPLGVTVYGLLRTAQALDDEALLEYLREHVQSTCSTFSYALWDKRQFGGATTLHNLLSSIDSLDDCGSFGSTMLEVARSVPIEGYRPIADYVAQYITKRQSRLPDGTFYRKELMHRFHNGTMWADDLYMSVPFLVRYAQLTGERRYLDDAARQFLGFKKLLYLPELQLMSHIFDFRRNLATGIPWGRGNGWTLFSLAELLTVLPATHRLRPRLLSFFRDFSAGILRHQDAAGMWHQVITHPDAYPETSCTAMFAYAYARGVQLGWYPNPRPYRAAAVKAWDALMKGSVDLHGNVHGVCRGSEFAFTPDYYKYDLLPNLNDTHGTGIVLLAGAELLKMVAKEAEKRAPARERVSGDRRGRSMVTA
jgi:rhamnogalacturonyl hydrolase YesR